MKYKISFQVIGNGEKIIEAESMEDALTEFMAKKEWAFSLESPDIMKVEEIKDVSTWPFKVACDGTKGNVDKQIKDAVTHFLDSNQNK